MKIQKFFFPGRMFLLGLSLICLSAGSGCTSKDAVEAPPVYRTFSSDLFHSTDQQPQCKNLLDSYCNYLYSPEVAGNLEIRRSERPTKVLQGETQNQFSQVFFTYAQAKLKNQQLFPRDFHRVLKRHNYFTKLSDFLNRKPIQSMTVSDRLEIEQMDYEIGMIWSAAINETVILRMNKKSPGFFKISKRLKPLELSLEETRTRRELISEISTAIWKGNENWQGVELTFARLRQSYLRLIEKMEASESLKASWKSRINDVKLVLPGSMPAISNDECSSTTVNAYYYTYLNVITVCAGDFNSEDILQTLAHEMGHALDNDRSQYIFKSHSQLGAALKALRENVCNPEAFACEQWDQFKGQFSDYLASLDGYSPDLPEFQKCLKRRPTTKNLADEDIRRLASSLTVDRISALASSDRFLRITKAEIPMPNGKKQKNPNYLDPCTYYLWSQGEEPVEDEITTLMLFTAAYRCSPKSPQEKLRESIELAKQMTIQILEKTLKVEGEFSSWDKMESEGYSSPPGERFADVVGSYAMSEYLQQIPHMWERRNKFLAGASWLCQKPSLSSHYPLESSIEKEFVFEAHTEGDQRRKEIFSNPIRETISCEKDFEFKECLLPLKSEINNY
ncbi:MAG: hypothetical protein ACAH59_08925 [Pseudobdellovibrionaceae bacterium]